MSKVLILGAGMVTRPMVEYLFNHGISLTLGDMFEEKARSMVGDNPLGRAVKINIEDATTISSLVPQHDLVVSMLPYVYHPTVARMCLEHNKSMVTASYVSPAMRELDAAAKSKGLLFLNEIGVDPGIDHMSAMRVINKVKKNGGKVSSFHSYCGGLPAPEANTNPLGYKFSWSPTGVMLAGKNNGRYLVDGKMIYLPSSELFAQIHYKRFASPIGTLEAYTNRDSIPYINIYGLEGIKTMFRGTLRYIGWCPTLHGLIKLGFLRNEWNAGLPATMGELSAVFAGGKASSARSDVAAFLGRPEDDFILDNMAWLDLLGNRAIPKDAKTPFDVLAAMFFEKMNYEAGERDLLVMLHEFIADYPDGHSEEITSTMIDYGIPNGDTSMARTVSLPAAIAVRLILDGKISLTGVQIPVLPEIYNPVLNELEEMGIGFEEKERIL